MELKIPVANLQKTLTLIQGVIHKRNTMPVLANVLISTEVDEQGKGTLTLAGTDLDVGMKTSQSCEVVAPGSITVSAKALLDVVKVLAGVSVSLKLLSNQQLQVKCGHTTATLYALSADEFPQLPDGDELSWHQLSAPVFLDMIQRTLYAASLDENRYNLTGVYFEPQALERSLLTLVATDGHRLSRVQNRIEDEAFGQFKPVIIPRKGLSELMRLLEIPQESSNDLFYMAISDKLAYVKHGNVQLTMRLINGVFPDYHQVIPKLADKILRASREDFLRSVKRVSVLANDKNQCIRFFAKKDEVCVSCNNPETGEVQDNIPVEYNGPDVELGFNVRYVLDALSSLNDSNVLMKFTDPLSPALLTGAKSDEHLCVIMPMRI